MFNGNQQLLLAEEAAQRKAEHTLLDKLLSLIDTLAVIPFEKKLKLNLLVLCGGRLSSAQKIQISYLILEE